ncbi:MAG: hypothetical protein IJ572_01230 [Bacilli bacterium]|nr:hypothetical protein [Bacilli bacterium]
MNQSYFTEMKRCKTDWLDDIFYGTKESKGTRNAVGAIKLVLFDDYDVVPDGVDIGDKYEFISSKFDGRAKAKMLQNIDLIQILCHYAMCSFGIKGENFTLNQSSYNYYRSQKITNHGYSKDFIIELVAYSLMDSIYGGYMLVSSNKFIREDLLDAFIEERYIEKKEHDLDTFDGTLINPLIDEENKLKYYTSFKNLDEDFFKIKRRDSEYISFEQNSNID